MKTVGKKNTNTGWRQLDNFSSQIHFKINLVAHIDMGSSNTTFVLYEATEKRSLSAVKPEDRSRHEGVSQLTSTLYTFVTS